MQTEFEFNENQLSGARITVPFTPLGQLGPKHHAIVVGENGNDGEVWLAELSRRHGYRLVPLAKWLEDNRQFATGMKLVSNEGPRSNAEVARSAIEEVVAHSRSAGQPGYHVLFNNCETFANRHLSGETSLSPQVRKAARLMGLAIGGGILLLKRRLQRS